MKTESTPFAILEVTTPKNHPSHQEGGIWARFYWSKNSGRYGHQVVTEYNIGKGFRTSKTGGCGFCKKSAALESFIGKLQKYKSLGGDLNWFLNGTRYHKGGNAYKIPLSKLDKINELRK